MYTEANTRKNRANFCPIKNIASPLTETSYCIWLTNTAEFQTFVINKQREKERRLLMYWQTNENVFFLSFLFPPLNVIMNMLDGDVDTQSNTLKPLIWAMNDLIQWIPTRNHVLAKYSGFVAWLGSKRRYVPNVRFLISFLSTSHIWIIFRITFFYFSITKYIYNYPKVIKKKISKYPKSKLFLKMSTIFEHLYL